MSFLKSFNKSISITALLVAVLFLTLQSCANSESDAQKRAREKVEQNVGTRVGDLQTGFAGTVYHYTCPNGHNEGADSDGGVCSECGAAFIHNDAYHNQPATTNPTVSSGSTSGVFHYSCPNGHAYGADNLGGTCPECGADYVHNDAYHNQNNNNNQITFDPTPSADSGITTSSSGNTSANFHYACPNGHEQGSDNLGGTCSECGAAFVHSDAYHANQNQTMQFDPSFQPQLTTTPAIQSGSSTAGGVYHYICPNGHEGGAASDGSRCAVCGTALVHNQAYHNQGF